MTNSNAEAKLATAQVEREKRRGKNFVKALFLRYGLLFIAIGVFIFFSFSHPRFLTPRNIFTLVGQGSIIGLLALGLTNILVVGEFDMSFAAIATFCGVLAIYLMGAQRMNVFFVFVICFGFGVGLSLFNATNVVYLRIPSFIATLGLMGVLSGISKWITGGSVLYYAFMPPAFGLVGRDVFAGLIPSSTISFFVGAIAVVIFLEYTYLGRYFYSVGGGGVEAAKRVAINVNKVKILAFLVMGIIAGWAGIVMASLFGVGNPAMGDAFLFPAIIAAFLGAIFLKEGLPNALGTVVAAMLLAMLGNGLVLHGFPLYVREIFNGIVLLVAVSMICIVKPGGLPGVKIG